MKFKTVSSLFILFIIYVQHLKAYRSSVVDYRPALKNSAKDTIFHNVRAYQDLTEIAREESSDIIIFPEYGLTTIVDDPYNYAVDLRDAESGFVRILSDTAATSSMYMVVNLLEKEIVRDSTCYYNTNVVFDRNGSLIAKYRKTNVFEEPWLTPGNETEIFATDFGAKFAMLTGADIYCQEPSDTIFSGSDQDIDIIHVYACKNSSQFLFSSWNTLQRGYFDSRNINLLVSRNCELHDGTSGIYEAEASGHKTDIIDTPIEGNLVITSQMGLNTKTRKRNRKKISSSGIPQNLLENSHNYLMFDKFRNNCSSRNIDLSRPWFSYVTILHNQVICKLIYDVKHTGNVSEIYKLIALEENVTKGNKTFRNQMCVLAACETSNFESCGKSVKTTSKFRWIKIKLEREHTSVQFPLVQSYKPTTVMDAEYSSNQLMTNTPQDGIQVFGIVGICEVNSTFQSNDNPVATTSWEAPQTSSSSAILIITVIIVIIGVIWLFKVYVCTLVCYSFRVNKTDQYNTASYRPSV